MLRTISFLKNLQVIVSTLLNSIPAMGSIVLLLFLVSYVFAIMGVRMFRETLPAKFGSMCEWVKPNSERGVRNLLFSFLLLVAHRRHGELHLVPINHVRRLVRAIRCHPYRRV